MRKPPVSPALCGKQSTRRAPFNFSHLSKTNNSRVMMFFSAGWWLFFHVDNIFCPTTLSSLDIVSAGKGRFWHLLTPPSPSATAVNLPSTWVRLDSPSDGRFFYGFRQWLPAWLTKVLEVVIQHPSLGTTGSRALLPLIVQFAMSPKNFFRDVFFTQARACDDDAARVTCRRKWINHWRCH